MKTRTRFYIHGIQKKYAAAAAVMLAAYTVILAAALLIPPSLKLRSGIPHEEQVMAASQVIALSGRLWPAIVISVPVFVVLTLWVTHKFAGPIYRMEQSLNRVAEGDLGEGVRLRSGDDLQELGSVINRVVERQAEALKKIRAVHQRLLETMSEVRSRSLAPEQINPMLERIQLQIEQLEVLLGQFQLDKGTSPRGRRHLGF
ncbi:MAG TPA: methyl-accepting chemotaxis protein [Nitrospiria bacterium]